VKRLLIRSNAFMREAKRLAKKNPQVLPAILSTLALLEEDAFHPHLRTHKLEGDLRGSWACSVSRDLRIVFELVTYDNQAAVLLQSLGTHDEVY
jgi:addiction module RelE/StbE family toxin